MLKIWADLWTALVRQLFIRQKLEALNNNQRNSLEAPEVVQVDAEPVTVLPSSRSASSRKVAAHAEIIPHSNSNRRRPQGQPVLPPAIEVVDERDLRVSRHSLRSVRKSGGQYPPTRLTSKDSKPLPPLPGTTPSNPNLLTVPSAYTRRPAAPQRLSRASTVINLRSSKVSGRLSTMAEEVVFRDVMKAAYDYAATAEDELTMKEDQLLYLLGNLDDDWAKVQVHVPLDALSEAEPAAGLVPSAYIEPAPPLYRAFALYDYEPNGEGELLMKENEKMSVYLKEDEWVLVKIDRKGTVSQSAIGYVPANYVEEGEGDGEAPAEEEVPVAAAPVSVPVPQTPATPTSQVNPAERAAAAAAKLKGDPVDIWNVSEIDKKGKKKKGTLGVGNGSIFFASEADKAPVQQWQVSMVTSVFVNEDKHKHVNLEISSPSGDVSLEFGAGSRDEANAIVEKVDRSKRLAVGESSPSRKSPEAAANTSSSPIKSPIPSAPNGGRFLPPPPSHPGLSPSPSGKSKGVRWDTAPPAEIPQAVQSDEESEGHTAAAAPPSAGKIVAIAMYDFEADGEDELTVNEGEKLTVLDNKESEEWWKCRNSKGKEGVVPASYLEVEEADEADDSAAVAEAARAEAARKEQEQAAAAAAKAKRLADESRRKREQEAREAQEQQEREEREEAEAREAEAQRQKEEKDRRAREARRREAEAQAQTSSKTSTNGTPKNHNRGQSKDLPGRPSLEKPKPTNTRIWHDRSGQFKVEAQFLGVHNNKIRLHKANGVIIEVPEEKMSATDMEYIRKFNRNPTSPTSPSANDDDVPLGTLSKSRPTSTQGPSSSRPQAPLRKSHVDWFEFFLNSGCDIDDCTRYATAFEREKIDEAILPDLKHDTLRGLGLREGDVIRVMKQIELRGWKVQPPRSSDPKVQEQMKKDAELAARLQEEEYGRKTPARNNTASPGLFTNPGGTLRNNTRRGRPTPTKSATLTVDASGIATASEQLSRTSTPANVSSPTTATPSTSKPPTSPPAVSGFEDDAWTPRPSSAASKPAPTPTSATSSAPAPVATPTPPPLPPAIPVQPVAPQPPAQPVAQPATTTAPKLASEFDVLAKIGTMRPPSAPAPPATAPLPSTISPPPAGFQQGMGMGSSSTPMGSFLQAQATGALSPLQALGGPRAPYAPVPQNEGLLKPLIPTSTGFNSFVPTRPGTAPATSLPTAGTTPSFLTSQPTGFNPSFNQAPQPSVSPLLTNPTGFSPSPNPMFQPPSATSSGFSTSSYLSANSAFQSPSPIVTQPTGFGNAGAGSGFGTQFGGPNPGSSFLNAVSSQPTGMFAGPPSVNPPPDNNSPANVFAAMKAGSFANAAAPQSSDRYDALRPQPTGWNALAPGLQPQPTGFNPGFGAGLQPGPNFGQPAGFQQPMQTGFGQPGYGGTQNQFGQYQR